MLVEAYSCGSVVTAPGVLMRDGLVLTAEEIGHRPWQAAVVIGTTAKAATVISYDDELGLATLRLDNGHDGDVVLARARSGAAVARGPNGTLLTGELVERDDGTFEFSAAQSVKPGSAVVNGNGALIGVVGSTTPNHVIPVAGSVLEGWTPDAPDSTCDERVDALGTANLDAIAAPAIRELLMIQRLSEAYASEDWEAVRSIEPGKNELTDQEFIDGWRPLERSFHMPVARTRLEGNRSSWRFGLVGHEQWNGADITTLFCVTWEVDRDSGTVVQTNEDTVRVFGSRADEPQRTGWADPGTLRTRILSMCPLS